MKKKMDSLASQPVAKAFRILYFLHINAIQTQIKIRDKVNFYSFESLIESPHIKKNGLRHNNSSLPRIAKKYIFNIRFASRVRDLNTVVWPLWNEAKFKILLELIALK